MDIYYGGSSWTINRRWKQVTHMDAAVFVKMTHFLIEKVQKRIDRICTNVTPKTSELQANKV